MLAEQLKDRAVLTTYPSGLNISGTVVGPGTPPRTAEGEETVAVEWDDDGLEDEIFTVAEALQMLVGPPPDPELPLEAPPTAAEVEAGFELYYKGRRQTLAKKNPSDDEATLRQKVVIKWGEEKEEKRLHYIRKVQATAPAAGRAAETAPPRVTISKGDPVPPVLIGRNKGLEIVLVERRLFPAGGLRGACLSEKDCGSTSCVPCEGPPSPGSISPTFEYFYHSHLCHIYHLCFSPIPYFSPIL